MINDFKQILVDDREIKRLCVELATRINHDYKENENVIFVGLLYGCYPFFSDLLKEINFHFEYDLMNVKSYESNESTGKINIVQDLIKDVKGKDVIIVDELIDTGLTMMSLKNILKERGANSVECCVLLQKKRDPQLDTGTKYIGDFIEDKWLAGYGLDFDNKYRYCNFIGELKHEITHPDDFQ